MESGPTRSSRNQFISRPARGLVNRTLVLVAVMAIVATACNASNVRTVRTTTTTTDVTNTVVIPPKRITALPTAHSLVAFDACVDFLDYVQQHALDMVGPWGLEGFGGRRLIDRSFAVLEGDFDAAAPGASRATNAYSTTNVQVTGVDEADIVKTDGRRIVTLLDNTLRVFDVTGTRPRPGGTLSFSDGEYPMDMFLFGDTVLVTVSQWAAVSRPFADFDVDYGGFYQSPITRFVEVDLRDIDEPTIVRSIEIDGSYISARMIDGTVRLALRSGPIGLVWESPEGDGLKAQRDAEQRNREIIEESTLENWVPYYVMNDGKGRLISEGTLLDCDRAHHPVEFAGLGMLSVITIDLEKGLGIEDAVGVLAEGETLYASHESLYVATGRWVNWAALEDESDIEDAVNEFGTDIHKFDISDPDRTEYIASGSVSGFMLSQWSMDEHDGYLRVATTSEPDWWGGARNSESFVTVLEDTGGELVEVGKVGGLGEGERIYSVRFMGDVGYVVTFRQTDPLYTLDLSEPDSPEVMGELKILGYSAYLHPLGDGLLLGVGQDATEQGRVQGTQLSVFDVSDLSDPIRLHKFTIEDGNSEVEWDHKAFLHWIESGLTVIPVQTWNWNERSGEETFRSGAIGVRIDRDTGISEVGRVSHMQDRDDWYAQIRRSIVIGDELYTVSSVGIMQSDLTTLAEEAWLPFNV